LGGCVRLSLTWDFGALLVWVGATGWALPWGVGPAGRWVCALGKYLDPAGNRDLYGPLNQEYGALKFPGTVLVDWRRKGSRVTWRHAVQFKMW